MDVPVDYQAKRCDCVSSCCEVAFAMLLSLITSDHVVFYFFISLSASSTFSMIIHAMSPLIYYWLFADHSSVRN